MGMDADVPDDVVELILLRLDSPLCLLRAASTCKQWRRVVAGAGFLRRFRSLHGPPPFAAVYYDGPRHPRRRPDVVVAPSVDIDGRFFSLDFLPDSDVSPWVWSIQDSRGSLLLLDRVRDAHGSASYRDVVICEPLTGRYERVAPLSTMKGCCILSAHLLDGEAGGIGISNFRVLCKLYSDGIRSDASLLTVGSDRRRSWRKISIDELMRSVGSSKDELAPSSLCWYNGARSIVAIDKSSGEFSSALLPEVEDWDFHKESLKFVFTAGHDGKARIVLIGDGGDLKVFARRHGVGEWALEKSIRLPAVTFWLPGYDPSYFSGGLLIHTEGTPVILLSPWQQERWWFHLDIETTEVAPAPDPSMDTAYPCELPWPPTLHACTSNLDV